MNTVNAVGKLVFVVLITFFSIEAYSAFQKLRDSKIGVSTSKQFSETRYWKLIVDYIFAYKIDCVFFRRYPSVSVCFVPSKLKTV